MSSFGKWYEDQQQASEDGNGSSTSSSWGVSSLTDTLPLFNAEGMSSSMSFSSMRESLEAQLPQKIMGMNYQQRFKMFVAVLSLSLLCFLLAFTIGLTLISVRPQKFAISFTFGSLLFMASFGFLKGPWAHLSSMVSSRERLPFTVVYLLSMFATLHFTFHTGGPFGYVLVLCASGFQLVALLWYLVTFLPGGTAGVKYLTQAMVTVLKPIIVGCVKVQAMCVARIVGYMSSSSSSSSSSLSSGTNGGST